MLDEIDNSCDYVVFDDVPYERFSAFKAFLGCQKEFVLTDKYRKKIKVTNWGKPCIVCLNEDMDYRNHLNFDLLTWFNDNVEVVKIENKLY